MNPKHPTRLEGLDALRGLAALSVLLYHYTAWYKYEAGGHPAPGIGLTFVHGNFGVDLFFIISGFVITMTLERTGSLAAFLFARLARLWPAFLASLAVTLTAEAMLTDVPTRGIAQILVNLTMVPDLFHVAPIDGSYWSLFFEWDFYLLAGIVFFLLGQRAPEVPCALWLAIALVLRLKALNGLHHEAVLLTGERCSQLFVIGVMLYRIRSGRAIRATWIILAFACLMTLLSRYWTLQSLPPWAYMVLVCLFAGIVWLAASPGLRVPAPLRFLGKISYPLYLVHQQAGFFLIERLEAAGIVPDMAVFLTFCSVILVAWAISATVEYPAQAWLKARQARWRGHRLVIRTPAGADTRTTPS